MASMEYVRKPPGFSLLQKPVKKNQAIDGIKTILNNKGLKKANQKMLKETVRITETFFQLFLPKKFQLSLAANPCASVLGKYFRCL